jgi:hypothetical protein
VNLKTDYWLKRHNIDILTAAHSSQKYWRCR